MSGVLTVTLMSANRLLFWLVSSKKRYVGVAKLHDDISDERVSRVCTEFQGCIYQTPPLKAAVKRQIRTRTIYSLKLLEKRDRLLLFETEVDAGTYIRKLCFDMGEALGVGMSMVELRRIASGPFREEDLVRLEELAYAAQLLKQGDTSEIYRVLTPVELGFPDLPFFIIRCNAADSLYRGASLSAPGVIAYSSEIQLGAPAAVFSEEGDLVELAEPSVSAEGLASVQHGIVATPLRVLDPVVRKSASE